MGHGACKGMGWAERPIPNDPNQEIPMEPNQKANGNGREGKSNRGFASMAPERQREIASLGGRAAHRDGTAHEFTSEEAREAGRKGGEARAQRSARRREQGSETPEAQRSNQADEAR